MPPPCARSGRPPPLPPTSGAISCTSRPAVNALRQVLGDGRDEGDLAVHRRIRGRSRPSRMRSRSVSITERSPSASRPSRRADEHRHAGDHLRGGGELLRAAPARARASSSRSCFSSCFCSSRSFWSRRGSSSGGILRRPADSRSAASSCPTCRERGLAGDRLDAADARGDGALGDDLEEPDLAGGVEVRAAAELGGEVADADDADAVAVLLAEQRHRPALERGAADPSRRGSTTMFACTCSLTRSSTSSRPRCP